MTRLLPILTLSRAGKVGMYISMYVCIVCMYVYADTYTPINYAANQGPQALWLT